MLYEGTSIDVCYRDYELRDIIALEGEPGQAFDSPFGTAKVSHYCPNDGCVEGLRCVDVPAFSVQYHPEAAAGPHDAAPLFDEFVTLMEKKAQ